MRLNIIEHNVQVIACIKRCRHVNKKALDQYMNFADQREELAQRQRENARGDEKIKQLIRTLDMKKDEAIERTFKAGLCTRLKRLIFFCTSVSFALHSFFQN